MILLKANSELKAVFLKLIKTMGEDLKWTEIFIINNSDLILAGKGRLLLFNFEHKKVSTSKVELPIKEDMIEQILKNELLENILNMTLYVFGKWGEIKGLKVEKEYAQINALFNNILDEIEVESIFTKDNLRFYKKGVQIIYEEVVQLILDKTKPLEETETQESKDDVIEEDVSQNSDSEENANKRNKYGIGLWHKIIWTGAKLLFESEALTKSDKAKSRIANNFYMVTYKCPFCREKLNMVVYPYGEEFLIETEEKGVYLSRAYTCSGCNRFYTPKPNQLLMEGDIFNIDFGDDKNAYEDYLELLGAQGERISNCNFNQYEAEYNRKNQVSEPGLEEICNDIDSMTQNEIERLKDKMDSGFYPKASTEKLYNFVSKELKIKVKKEKSKTKSKKNANIKSKGKDIDRKVDYIEREVPREKDIPREKETHMDGENPSKSMQQKHRLAQNDQKSEPQKSEPQKSEPQKSEPQKFEKENKTEIFQEFKRIISAIFKGDNELFTKSIEKLSPKELKDLKILINSEQGLDEGNRKNYIEKVDRYIYQEKEKELIKKAISCKEKTYANIVQVIEEIKNEDLAEDRKKSILESLTELLSRRAKTELEYIVTKIPENISRIQYKQFKEKIKSYDAVDHSVPMKILDEKRDVSEKQEITTLIKRSNAKDRNSLLDLYNKLKKSDYEVKNTTPYLEKIYDRIHSNDEAAIKKICPDIDNFTFEEGLEAYEEIESEDFLPELKLNILGIIDRRLTKIKMDECEQLVHKLSKDMKSSVKDCSRIYLNQVHRMVQKDLVDAESRIIQNAMNSFATQRGKYEFPILVWDTSHRENGGKGFLLTPDHIYYKGLLNSGIIDVMDIDTIYDQIQLFHKGIYVNKKNGEKEKIGDPIKFQGFKEFAKSINDFVSYLKEKPESRKISYMAKEKHKVICCYRCGYLYKEGVVCPKCGGKFNE